MLAISTIHVDVPSKPDAAQFLSSLEEAGLKQHVTELTHTHGHILDLIISRSDDCFVKDCQVFDKLLSDHCVVTCVVDASKPPLQNVTSCSRNL